MLFKLKPHFFVLTVLKLNFNTLHKNACLTNHFPYGWRIHFKVDISGLRACTPTWNLEINILSLKKSEEYLVSLKNNLIKKVYNKYCSCFN